MEMNETLNKIDRELRKTVWKYKFWENEEVLEFRNTAKGMSGEWLKNRIDDILKEILEEGKFKPLLAGKIGLMVEDGKLWKTTIDENGYPDDKIEKLDKNDARKLIHKSLHRVDNDLLVSNRLVLDLEEIVDIFSERSQGKKFINISMEGTKRIILHEDGGLEFST